MEKTVHSVHQAEDIHGLTQVAARKLILDPQRAADWDPFILWGEDWVPGSGGFPDHPHRGFETVTLLLEGGFVHRDSAGHEGVLQAGDVQWMTAGRGVLHSEMPVDQAPVHGLQLWVNLPAAVKMTAPSYQDLRAAQIPVRREPGAVLRVISGRSGAVEAPTRNHVPVQLIEMRLEAGATITHEIPEAFNSLFYVLEGGAQIRDTRLPAGSVARLLPGTGTTLRVTATETLHAILIAGQPIGEPIAFGGAFVMNHPEELARAREDLRRGRFAI